MEKSRFLSVIVILLFFIVATSGCVNQNNNTNTTPITYTQKDADYFSEIAFGTEYGSSDTRLAKWTGDIRVKVTGSPTDEDMKMINYTLSELNNDLNGITITLNSNNPNMEIYFVPQSEFSKYIPQYVPGNEGFMYIWWNANKEIYKSKIVISTGSTQADRSHLIIHEITQSMGLGIDSNKYPDSIFNELPNKSNKYTEIDKTIIKMLYQYNLKAGMTKEETMQIINQNIK
ncbi:MAG: DUF2927 domain-containing protein [Methanobacterium sp.]|nr:DUF2927 domain-containing protein [Methanobacterium sp.]